MLMHATAHGDCTDTARESALEADSGREKKSLTHKGFEPASVLHLAFQFDALPHELSPSFSGSVCHNCWVTDCSQSVSQSVLLT